MQHLKKIFSLLVMCPIHIVTFFIVIAWISVAFATWDRAFIIDETFMIVTAIGSFWFIWSAVAGLEKHIHRAHDLTHREKPEDNK